MSRTDLDRYKGKIILPAAVLCLASIALFTGAQMNSETAEASAAHAVGSSPPAMFSAPAATFAGANLGGIPDSAGCGPTPGTPRNVTFGVTGLSGNVSNVGLSMTIGTPIHTWMGDIVATLIAPNGASHTLFGVTLSTTATGIGDSSDLGGTYVFADSAAAPPNGGWWQAATAAGPAVVMPSGTYRTTASGGAGQVNPAPPTNMNASFAGVSDPNGEWTLRLTDGCTGDTGAITAATLTVEAGPAVVIDANVDINGDGRTDFVVARGTTTPFSEGAVMTPGRIGGNYASLDERPVKGAVKPTTESPQAPPIYWYTLLNNSGVTSVVQLGDAATDYLTPEDFDGDGKDDYAVWTEGPSGVAHFKILRSSTSTVDVQVFGQTGDDPAIVGDYDGDNIADPAVFRCPSFGAPAGQCFFFYRGSNANPAGNITYVPWGFGVDGDFFPNIGDFDGDGKYDFCLQRAHPAAPGQGQFVLLRSLDFGVEYINWGLSSDFIIPGDYDGDGKADFCVRRTVGGNRQHWILHRTGAQAFIVWGITGDVSVPGDYDGDGRTDLAIWRGNPNPTQNFFWIRNSTNGSVSVTGWGQCATVSTCDFPVAGWAVH